MPDGDLTLLTPRQTLDTVLAALAADPFVENVAIGGSFARGEADEVSDLDLWIEGKWWQPDSLGSLFLTTQTMTLGKTPFLHGVTVGGTVVDIMHGPPVQGDYVDLTLPSPTPIPPKPLPGGGLVDEFWLTTLKHRKNVWRGDYGVLVFGLEHDRKFLLRAWATREGSRDPGPAAFGIFPLRGLVAKYLNPERQALLGLPLRTPGEILYALLAYRDEMSRQFPNVTQLERTVRALPLTPPKST